MVALLQAIDFKVILLLTIEQQRQQFLEISNLVVLVMKLFIMVVLWLIMTTIQQVVFIIGKSMQLEKFILLGKREVQLVVIMLNFNQPL
ncbi:MAG: hypothetical protein CMB22_02670 [Euryarchaeota archaeon]|nr:hypothetical protein [Euryarchaeota archaeon]